jgi:hypothetical protein
MLMIKDGFVFLRIPPECQGSLITEPGEQSYPDPRPSDMDA